MRKRTRKKTNRIDILLSEGEMSFCKAEMKRTNVACQTDVIREIIRERMLSMACSDLDEPKAKKSRGQTNEAFEASILERFAKLERLQRSILINTSVARSHATAVMEVGEKVLASKLKTHMLDATEKQKAIYFDLYPEQKEAQS